MAKQSAVNIFDKAYADLFDDDVSEKAENEYNPNLYSENFDDEGESWGDVHSEVTYQAPIVSKPVIEKEKAKPQIKYPAKDSALVKKYFNIKTEEKIQKIEPKKGNEEAVNYISSKIEELNMQISVLKKECDKGKRLSIQYDEKKRMFLKEKEELERLEEAIKNEVDEFNEMELEKYKRELKVHERNQKVLANVPSKKERDEIDALKNMLEKVKEEATIKHNRYRLNKDRVSKLIEDAKKKKAELLQRLEKLDSLDAAQEVFESPISVPKAKPLKNNELDSRCDLTSNSKQTSQVTLPSTVTPKNPSVFDLDIFDNSQSKSSIGNSILYPPTTKKNIENMDISQTKALITTTPSNLIKSRSDNNIGSLIDLDICNLPQKKIEKIENIENTPNISTTSNNPSNKKTQIFEPECLKSPEYSENIPIVDKKTLQDGRVIILYESGHKEILYPNGTKKEEYPNGYIVVFYGNNDIKQTFPDGKSLYFFAEANAIHTCLPNGLEIIRFGNGQIEKNYPDGSRKIKYIDGTVKNISSNGDEETTYPDNTRETCNLLGERIIFHPGGHKEYIANNVKKRVYFNGNSKLLKK